MRAEAEHWGLQPRHCWMEWRPYIGRRWGRVAQHGLLLHRPHRCAVEKRPV